MAGVFAALVILLLLILVALPTVINLQPIKTKILNDVSHRIGGRVSSKSIDISLLPSPRLSFQQMHFSKEGRFAGSLESLIVYPQILPLMRGEVKLDRMRLVAPDFELKIRGKSESNQEKKPIKLMIEELREKSVKALRWAALQTPALSVEVEKGQLRLAIENEPAFQFSAINSSIHLPPEQFQAKLTCESNLWKSLALAIEIDSNFALNGTLDVADFQPQLLAGYVVSPQLMTIANGDLSLNAEFASKNFKTLHANVQGSIPQLTVIKQSDKLPIKCENLKAAIDVNANEMSVDLTELLLNYPKLKLSGKFLRDGNPSRYRLFLKGEEIDVDSTRNVSLALLGKFEVARKIFDIVRGGTVAEITFSTHGNSAHDLGKAENIHIVGSMKNGKIFVPKADLDLTEVFGKVDISNGILEGEGLRARLENSRGQDGYLRIGLRGRDAPFHLDIVIDADLAQLPPILLRVVKNKRFDNEINLIKSLAGSGKGRLVLGDSLDSVKAVVDVTDIKLKASYQRLPYPLEICNGQFSYDGIKKTVSVKDLTGNLGKSTFSAFSAELSWSNTYQLQVTSANANLSVDQTYPWITSYSRIRRTLKEFKFNKGQVTVESLHLTGPLLNPDKWQFETSGAIQNLAVNWTSFPATLSISAGKFKGVPTKLMLIDTQASMLDASFKATAELDDFRKGLLAADLKISGTLGAKSIKWIADLSNLPSQLYFRPPLLVTTGHLVWERNSRTTFTGVLTPQDGPKVTIDQTWRKDDLNIRKLLIQDAESNASISADLKPEALELTFSGNLTKSTADQLLQNNDVLWGWINGNFSAHIFFTDYMMSTAQGILKGQGINVSAIAGLDQIQNFSINANEKSINVESATILLEDNRLETKGNVIFSKDGFLVDLDVTTNGIEWTSIKKILDAAKHNATKSRQFERLQVHGEIKFHADFFAFERYTMQPFQADIHLTSSGIQVLITKAELCGIPVPGVIETSDQKIRIEFKPQAQNMQLKPTLVCLFENKSLMVGNFSFQADIKGQISDGQFIKSLAGGFNFNSDDGRIYRFGLLEKIFSVLNFTEIFRGKIPDLAQEGFGYDSIKIQGNLSDGKIEIDEAIIKGTSLEMVGSGSVDLANKGINLTVLVAPLKTINVIISHIPIVGGILGAIVSVPVQVTGDLSNPVVIPLSPTAVGSELLGIMKKTIELPLKIIQPLMQQDVNKKSEEIPHQQESPKKVK